MSNFRTEYWQEDLMDTFHEKNHRKAVQNSIKFRHHFRGVLAYLPKNVVFTLKVGMAHLDLRLKRSKSLHNSCVDLQQTHQRPVRRIDNQSKDLLPMMLSKTVV